MLRISLSMFDTVCSAVYYFIFHNNVLVIFSADKIKNKIIVLVSIFQADVHTYRVTYVPFMGVTVISLLTFDESLIELLVTGDQSSYYCKCY